MVFENINWLVSAELFSAAKCNLRCKYCYIPKTGIVNEIHDKIISKIEDGSFLEQMKKVFGKNLECISHWGTEPTLTLNKFYPFYTEVLKEFPRFREVLLSSNFMTDPSIISDFIINFPKVEGRKISFEIQMSLDGPEWITDENRKGGSTKTISKNIVKFFENINNSNVDCNIFAHFKPTIDQNQIKELSNIDRMIDYYSFFDDLNRQLIEKNRNKKICFITECMPTVVVPGSYTTEDGINFHKLVLNQDKLSKSKKFKYAIPVMTFYSHFLNTINAMRYTATRQFTYGCSAGRSLLALAEDNNIHCCHKTFYSDIDEMIPEIKKHFKNSSYCVGYDQSRDDLYRKFVANINDDKNCSRLLYTSRGYTDFYKFKISMTYSLLMELADSGQISKIYGDLEHPIVELFTQFQRARGCYFDNVINSGSFNILSISTIRLLANGAFEEFYRKAFESI